jgi:predicted transcriptional regulator
VDQHQCLVLEQVWFACQVRVLEENEIIYHRKEGNVTTDATSLHRLETSEFLLFFMCTC